MSKKAERSRAIRSGIHFGLPSGIITTIGLMVGLHSGTHSTAAVVGGLVTIAIADSLSDSLGIHISKEGEGRASKKEIWLTTVMTLLSKAFIVSSFIIPVLLFDLTTAILVAIAWGMSILVVISYRMARNRGENPLYVIGEHLGIAILVIVITHLAGGWIARVFAP